MRNKLPMQNSPIRQIPWLQWNHALWLLILLVSCLVQASQSVPSWRFDRILIDQGDYWLLFSGHFAHLNWSHWGLNMAGLAIVAFFFSTHARVWQWLVVIALSAGFVGLGLYWLNPDVVRYVGLSGVLHGMFIFGAVREIRLYPASGYALLALLVGKLAWEFFNGALPGSEALVVGRVVTDAHLYGAVGGALASLLTYQLVKVENRQQNTQHDQ